MTTIFDVDFLRPAFEAKPKIEFVASLPHLHFTFKGVTAMILSDIQQVSLSLNPVDAVGNPTTLKDTPVWEVSDQLIIELIVSPDGLNAVARSAGRLGTAQVSVTDGAMHGTLSLQVVSSDAVSISIGVGTPEPIPSLSPPSA